MRSNLFTLPGVRQVVFIGLLCGSFFLSTASASAAPGTTSVTISGEITDTGGIPPTVRGVVYGTTPSYGATTTESGNFSAGPYSVTLTGLLCNADYHYANYATNGQGTGYGADREFTTGACDPLPVPPTEPASTSPQIVAPGTPAVEPSANTGGNGSPTGTGSSSDSPGSDTTTGSSEVTGDTPLGQSPGSTVRAAIERIPPEVLKTAEVAGVVGVSYAALYATGVNRFITSAVLGLLAWLAYFGAAKSIRRKKIGIIGTHNLYVIVGDALEETVVERVYRLKGKTPSNPYPVLISSWEELEQFGIKLNRKQEEALRKKYWPGPVNVMLPCTLSKFTYLHRGTNTLTFRFPADFLTQSLLRRTGPVIAPTANPEGLPPATTIAEAKNYFKEEIDFFINKGTLAGLPPMLIQMDSEGEVTVLSKGGEKIL
ncbi:MAG: Sua5/YciO/YrdC/YwlC family protein [Parcubacteria group bacterium]|nr:Sua5/YciO/YrdC/YwlC family protein [Parcubacteria group bacterium]